MPARQWSRKPEAIQMPYERPIENDTANTDLAREDIPRPLKNFSTSTATIEQELQTAFKQSTTTRLYEPSELMSAQV